jgi:hypothetical protein
MLRLKEAKKVEKGKQASQPPTQRLLLLASPLVIPSACGCGLVHWQQQARHMQETHSKETEASKARAAAAVLAIQRSLI